MAKLHGNRRHLSIYLDQDEWAWLQAQARKAGQGMATEVRSILRRQMPENVVELRDDDQNGRAA